MKGIWLKITVIAVTLVLIACAAYYSLYVKTTVVNDVYDTVQFSLTKVEAEQYVNRIEYGLKYGKQLDKYYGMDELLTEMHMSSSYLQGVYVVDSWLNTLGSSTGTRLSQMKGGMQSIGMGEYRIDTEYGVTYIAISIYDEFGSVAGMLVLKLTADAAGNLKSDDRNSSFLRTGVIAAFFGALAIIFFIRFLGKKRKLPVMTAIMLLFVLLSQAADSAVEAYWANITIEQTAESSAKRIAQVLQKQLDSVVEMGAKYEDIGSLETFFSDNANSIESIDSFSLDTGNKVKATVSREFCRNASGDVNTILLIAFAMTFSVCAGLWGIAFGIYMLIRYKKQKQPLSEEDAARDKQVIRRRSDIQELTTEEYAQIVLGESAGQNIMLIACLNRGAVKDIEVFEGGVRFYDEKCARYMFYARTQSIFDALFANAARKPSIFFISTDDIKPDASEYTSIKYEQAIANKPADIPEKGSEFEYGTYLEKDAELIIKLAVSEEFNREYIIGRMDEGPVVCAYEDDELAGFVLTHADGETGPMYILPEFRQRGIGTQLICRLTRMLLNEGYPVYGHIKIGNEYSARLHKGLGYVTCRKKVQWVYSKKLGFIEK